MIAISAVDDDGYNRHDGLLTLVPGDQITELGTNDSQNYQSWTVTSIVDQGTWFQIGVQVIGAGTAFVTPGMNQSRILQALQVKVQEELPPGSPTSGGLPNIATPDDIVSRLGRNLNQTEAARVDAMLADGSAIIRRHARNTFTYVAYDSITLVADNGIIVLPGRPIESVDEVTWVPGAPGIPEMPVYWFIFDGVDTVTIPDPRASGIINLPEAWYDTGWYSDSFRIVFSHGYVQVPADIKGLLCSAIISELSTPTLSATVQSEAIGAYSYSMRRRDTGGGMFAALKDFGMIELLAEYRRKFGTLAVKAI
jgi:hypothetical protein